MKTLDLLLTRRLPARLLAEQVAVLLNIHQHDVPVLVKAGILRPLATSSTPNTVKFFAAVEIERISRDVAALSKLTRVLQDHWRKHNYQKR
jgi:hypothetical protein